MRIFTRAHLPWFILVVLATVAASFVYLNTFHPHRLSFAVPTPELAGENRGYVNVGATPLGLILGSVSFAIFMFAGLLGLRKKVVLWRIGTVQAWLRAHVWLTLLTIPLVILHTGFRLGGPMTSFLVVLYAVVMASGIYGLALQHYVPKLMKERLPAEAVYEQIPYIRSQLCRQAEKMRDFLKSTAPSPETPGVKTASNAASVLRDQSGKFHAVNISLGAAPLQLEKATMVDTEGAAPTLPQDTESQTVLLDFLETQALPYLRKPSVRRTGLASRSYSEDMFRFLQLRTAQNYHYLVREIQALCDERRMLDYQVRLHHWLHYWLFVHVPLSYFLILMTAWHAFLTLFRY
jgi:hypothetical protein